MNILWLIVALFIVVLIENTYAVECEFCHKDFRHLNKHLWRCKERINRDVNTNLHVTSTDQRISDFIAVNDPLRMHKGFSTILRIFFYKNKNTQKSYIKPYII